ncbi:MAG TPA: DUF4383 domain-containing protein [Baekduia sp.]|nr:DUF4383 domain-containing protein [Baekduia sp.]
MRSPFRRRRHAGATHVRHEGAATRHDGVSLAKGPALIIGSILLAFGLGSLIGHNDFPAFDDNFPDGTAEGTTTLGIETNGWTNWLAIAAGGLLLFGLARHGLAKMMSLIVGLALGAAAIIGLIDGDILGLGASNGWTELALGIASALLLLNVFMPKAGKRHDHHTVVERDADLVERDRRVATDDRTEVVGPHDPATRSERFAREERTEHLPPR